MLRKAYTPVRLFVESLLYLAAGVWLFARPQTSLTWLVEVSRWLLAGGAVFVLAEGLLHGREKRADFAKAGLLGAGAAALFWWPAAAGASVSVIFGAWVTLNALCKLVYGLQLLHDGQRGWLSNFIMCGVQAAFAVGLFVQPVAGMLSLTVLLGLYCIVYGLFALGDAFRELLSTDVKGRRIRQRIRIAPPILLTALLPKWLLRMLDDPSEKEETARWTRRETNDAQATADMEIFFHLSKDTAMGFGHVDIALGDTVYAYGCYDSGSNRLFGMISDGVLVTADRARYVPYCLEHERKKLIGFGVSLDEVQRARVRQAAEHFMAGSVLWTPAAGSEQDGFAQATGAHFHKLTRGPFKTYNVVKTNCVALADLLCGASGLDLMNTQGIVTPGTYFTFIDRQFRRKNSIVISRTVYR